jgi:hypothetical protein
VIGASAEIMASVALVGGWILVTLAVAEYAPTRVTWLASAGLFLLSCFGWGPLLVLARFGLYSATRDEKKGSAMRNPFAFAHQQLSDSRARWHRASAWNGGVDHRLYSDWEAWTLSPDYEVRAQFRLLRARARDLAKNNPWVGGFVDEIANNVVGQSGIMLQADTRGPDRKPVKDINREIERAFGDWSMPEFASADAHDSWIELQRLIIQTIAIDGECLVRRLRGFDQPVRLRPADDRRRSARRDVQRRPLARGRTRSRWASRSIAGIDPSRITSGIATAKT